MRQACGLIPGTITKRCCRLCMDSSPGARAGQVPVHETTRYERFVRLVSHPNAALGIAAQAFVMSLPAIATGLAADDFDLAFAVTQDPLSAYAFQSRDPSVRHAQLSFRRDAGTIPWWSDLEFHQAFFRPLSSLSLALDFKLWPSAPWLMHIENGLLFALIVLIAASVYKRLGLSNRARGLATAFFAMQPAQSMSVGWISGRNTLLATLFGLLSVRLFIAARSGGGIRVLALSLFSFVAALLSAEVGVSAIAYVFAFAMCLGAQSKSASAPAHDRRALVTRPMLREQLGPLAPFALAIVAWLSFYKLNGYGVQNSGFYLDVTHDPLRFLSNLMFAIPIYLASLLTFPFAACSVLAQHAAPVLAGLSLLILYASRRLWLPWVREDSRGRVLGLGALLAIIPLGSSPPQDRMVSFVALGVCGLVALIVDERLGTQRSSSPQKGALRLLRLHAIWAPILYIPYLFGSMALVAGGGGVLLDETLGDDPRPVVLVNAPAYLPVHFFARKRAWFGQAHPPIDLLYGGSAELDLTRTGEQTLLLTASGEYGAPLSLDRAPERLLHLNEVIPSGRMSAQVLELRKGAPSRVRFEFTEPLADVRLYAWHGRRLVPLALPKIGEQTHIAAASAM